MTIFIPHKLVLRMKHFFHRRILSSSILLFVLVQFSYGKVNKSLMHPAPIVNFEISHFCLGDSTYFTNKSQLGNSYLWNIYKVINGPHGSLIDSLIFTSTNFNISYLFPYSAHYIVELTGFNGHTIMISRDFVIDSVTHANFNYMYCGSKFENMSVCYDSCLWDFGDGHTSAEDSPVHFYDSLAAWYPVKLITYNANSTDVHFDSVFANSPNNLDANFTYKVNRDSVLFLADDSVSGPFTQYHWSFGDGAVADLYTTSGGRKVYHRYVKKDTIYTVFLLAKTTCLNAFSQANVFVIDSTAAKSTYIFPNPISENTLLSIATERKDELKDIYIIDCLGKAMSNYNITETVKGFNVDVSCLVKGMYFVRLNFIDGIVTKKILKQ
jgi:PKD repeat protein